MNRTELIEAVAARAGSDPAAARRHVDAVFEEIMERVAAGERVLVTGFGTFDRLSRPARTARNPRTGQPVEVPATEAPRFRVGQTFRDRVGRGVPAAEAPAAPAAEEVPVVEEAPVPAPAKGKKARKGGKAEAPKKKAKAGAEAPRKGKKAAEPKGRKKKK
ncbi:HU family DNA-binding protein [Thermomonospora cellulosilytica]|uniref:DNA-binding protein HU-beta n=1 Tax=Thermomonospora cellulosilytica TaxID=1411118 RepID=A0A7W3R927_9ACTN|nr:HU family DNA-binding protein [Thermomonospora cellulosilytica]MBA9003930.1 DNA-binding protein HU-beta [Thermomonospora cellulosilytica]